MPSIRPIVLVTIRWAILRPVSISHTLEYAYTDWCISQLAKALGKEDDAKELC